MKDWKGTLLHVLGSAWKLAAVGPRSGETQQETEKRNSLDSGRLERGPDDPDAPRPLARVLEQGPARPESIQLPPPPPPSR